MLNREGNVFYVTDSTGVRRRYTDLNKAFKAEHYVNLSNKGREKAKNILKEVRAEVRSFKKNSIGDKPRVELR